MEWWQRLGREAEIHVWTLHLDDAMPALQPCLSQAEEERAGRVASDRERARFAATRTALRQLLGRYMDADPARLCIDERPGGKPVLADGPEFSVTHSGALALIAVSPTEVGVDVERVRAPRSRRVLLRIFHPQTIAALDAAGSDAFAEAFTRAWTQREAHVKAEGGGLFRTPDVLPFEAQPREHSLRRVTDRDGREWSVSHWTEQPGMIASVVAAGRVSRVRHMFWPVAASIDSLPWR